MRYVVALKKIVNNTTKGDFTIKGFLFEIRSYF